MPLLFFLLTCKYQILYFFKFSVVISLSWAEKSQIPGMTRNTGPALVQMLTGIHKEAAVWTEQSPAGHRANQVTPV
jgi:hypothetical protein